MKSPLIVLACSPALQGRSIQEAINFPQRVANEQTTKRRGMPWQRRWSNEARAAAWRQASPVACKFDSCLRLYQKRQVPFWFESTDVSLQQDPQALIPASFQYVAQAVALNEHRGRASSHGRAHQDDWQNTMGAFPLESIMGGTAPPNAIRIEKGFVGAHADIGGGFTDNTLSKVAMAWMYDQAKLAHVEMISKTFTVPANPVIHDKSDNIQNGWPNGTARPDGVSTYFEDRTVHYMNGAPSTTQRKMTGTGMTWADTQQMIQYKDRDKMPRDVNPNRTSGAPINYLSDETGTVDMRLYKDWLDKNGYGITSLQIQ